MCHLGRSPSEEKVRRKGREEVNGGEKEERTRWHERPSGIGQDKRNGDLIENSGGNGTGLYSVLYS